MYVIEKAIIAGGGIMNAPAPSKQWYWHQGARTVLKSKFLNSLLLGIATSGQRMLWLGRSVIKRQEGRRAVRTTFIFNEFPRHGLIAGTIKSSAGIWT